MYEAKSRFPFPHNMFNAMRCACKQLCIGKNDVLLTLMSHNTAELPPLQLVVFKLCGLFREFQHEVCATRFAMIHQPDSIQTSTHPQNLRYLKMSPPRDTSNCPSQFYSSRILARHLHQDESFQTCGRWTGARHLAWLSPNLDCPSYSEQQRPSSSRCWN